MSGLEKLTLLTYPKPEDPAEIEVLNNNFKTLTEYVSLKPIEFDVTIYISDWTDGTKYFPDGKQLDYDPDNMPGRYLQTVNCNIPEGTYPTYLLCAPKITDDTTNVKMLHDIAISGVDLVWHSILPPDKGVLKLCWRARNRKPELPLTFTITLI